MRVSAILKGRKDKDGRQSVQIRVNDGQKRRFYALKIKVKDTQFKNGKVIDHPQAGHLNQVIKREISNREITPLTSDPDFYAYAEKCIKYWREANIKGSGTLRHYESLLNKIRKHRKSFRLSDMNNSFFGSLLAHFYSLGNKENTAWTNFSKLHAILQQAVYEEIISKNPLNGFKDFPKYKNPKRDFLTPKQVDSIESFALHAASPEQRFSALWFLIGCYTGLRISDMRNFSKKDIVGKRIIKENVKTKELISLPLEGKIRELLDLVNYQPLKITNEAYNRMLKVMAEKCGIGFNLVAHSSRHTAAMMLMNTGASLDEIAAVLGHVNTKHTKIYAKISNQRIDIAMNRIIKPGK